MPSPPWMISAAPIIGVSTSSFQRPHFPLPYHPVINRSYTTFELSNVNPLFSADLLKYLHCQCFTVPWALSELHFLPSLNCILQSIFIISSLSLIQPCLEKLQFWINHNIHLLFACTGAARCSWRNHSIILSGFILKSWFQTSEWPSILLSNPNTCP